MRSPTQPLHLRELTMQRSRFLKRFDLSTPRVMSPINGDASAVFTTMVVCLALEAIMKYQVKQLNKIGVPATAMGIDEEAEKKRKVRDRVRLSFCFQYINLLLCRV